MKEKNSHSFITCNCNGKLHITLFLLPISFIILRFIHDKIFFLIKPEGSYKILKFNLPYLFYLYLPKIFSIIFIFIVKLNIKKEKSEKFLNTTTTKNYHIVKKHEYEKKMIILLFIASLLEVLYDNIDCYAFFYQMKGKLSWLVEKKTAYIIFVPIFSYFILDKKLYRHHSLALILGFIGACIINVCRFPLGFSKVKEYPFHLLNIFLSSLYSLALVLIKYIMIKYVILSPYLLLFYDGIFCIVISIIVTLIEYFFVFKLPEVENENSENFFYNNFVGIITIFKGQSNTFFILFFISMILSFCYYISNIYIIYRFSPFVNILVELISPIDSDILDCVIFNTTNDHPAKDILKRFFFQSFGYIILFFAALILNEIIILNFWGCSQNTFLNISSRSKMDSLALVNFGNDNEIINENDDQTSCEED